MTQKEMCIIRGMMYPENIIAVAGLAEMYSLEGVYTPP